VREAVSPSRVFPCRFHVDKPLPVDIHKRYPHILYRPLYIKYRRNYKYSKVRSILGQILPRRRLHSGRQSSTGLVSTMLNIWTGIETKFEQKPRHKTIPNHPTEAEVTFPKTRICLSIMDMSNHTKNIWLGSLGGALALIIVLFIFFCALKIARRVG